MLLPMVTAPGTAPSRRARTLVTLLLVVAGLALLLWQVRQLGLSPADLAESFAEVGWWFVVVLLLGLGRFVLRSYAWRALFEPALPLRTVVAATISGDALGNVTPLGLAASEPAKALYLRRLVDVGRSGAALTAENFFYSVSVAVFVLLGTAAMLAFFAVPAGVRLAAIAAVGAMVVVLVGAAWLAWQRPSITAQVLGRLPVPRLATVVARIAEFEQATYGAAGSRGGALALVAAAETAFHVLSFVECWLIFWLLTGETSLLPALIFDGFNRVVNIVFKVVPMRLGVEEGGTALLAQAIGYPAHAGFLLGLVRKVRVLVFAAIGLALWSARPKVRGTRYEVRSTE